jgi:hypothetical protein
MEVQLIHGLPEPVLATSVHAMCVDDRSDSLGCRRSGPTKCPAGAIGNNLGSGVLRGSSARRIVGGISGGKGPGRGTRCSIHAAKGTRGDISAAGESSTCIHISLHNRQGEIISNVQEG